jgi:hypothetical protein
VVVMDMKRGTLSHHAALVNRRMNAVAAGLLLLFAASCVEDKGRPTIGSDTDNSSIAVIDPCREAEAVEIDYIEKFEFGTATQWWVSYDPTKETFTEIDALQCDTVEKMAKDTCFIHTRPEDICEDASRIPDNYCFVEHWPGREPASTELTSGRCGVSRYALRMVTDNLQIYGGALGLNFYLDPHDESDWDGISLWARREPDTKDHTYGKSLFFGVSDKYTDESNGKLLFENGEPYCLEVTDDDTQKCDRFGAGIGIDTEWRFFKIPFSELKQRGYGRPAPELDVGAILGLNIGFEAGDWDFWIDDVGFYRDNGVEPADSDSQTVNVDSEESDFTEDAGMIDDGQDAGLINADIEC